MLIHRRAFLGMAGIAAAAAAERRVPEWEKPLFDLHKVSGAPVKIRSIELYRNGPNFFVKATSADGATGLAFTKQVEDWIPILLRRAAPFFIGKDARDLESLIDGVYIENYKMAGQAFWAPVAYVEQSLFDLLGKICAKPVGALLGGVRRTEIPVYLSGSGRETTAEQEVDVYVRGVAETGARAVKFKIGGRMSRNLDAYPGRTETLMKLARKRLGDGVILYADANGSYDAHAAIEVGRMLQDLGCAFFEEPCPWEEMSETKKVADALDIPIAYGEQNSSLWQFQWLMDTKTINIVQPDLNYNGGFIRASRVARMARAAKITIVPHNTQTGQTSVNILHFASAIPNTGPYMEYPHRGPEKKAGWYAPQFEIKDGKVKAPTGPGLGLDVDPKWLEAAKKVEA